MTRRRVLRNWDEAVRFQRAFRGLDFRLLASLGGPRCLRRRGAQVERRIEEDRRRLDVLDEQSRRREELQQKRRRMRLLRAVLSAGCDRLAKTNRIDAFVLARFAAAHILAAILAVVC
jgi:hypothetical protein